MTSKSPYLTAVEAAAHLRIEHKDGTPNVGAFYCWRHRHPELKATKRGGRLLFRVEDLDRTLRREGSEQRHYFARGGRAS